MSASSTLRRRSARLAGALTITAVGAGGLLGAVAPSAHAAATTGHNYTFTTIDNPGDPTFNQLLGINKAGVISGYFGSGMPGHPNQGYYIPTPYTGFNSLNVPGAAQTQVTSLNNKGDFAGFWANAAGTTNHAFVEWNGVFANYHDPAAFKGSKDVEQVLGINDAGIAVGFYTNSSGTHPFKLNQASGKFTNFKVPGTDAQATSIDDNGDIAGFSSLNGVNYGWLIHNGHRAELSYPGSTGTQVFGVNDHQELVGVYLDGSGVQHGFVVTTPLTDAVWTTIDDPFAVPGTTFVNGVNDRGQIVGFYTDAATNDDGFLAS